ncbi:hypothetical protein CYMTET_36179, partial [Cymbomonas tetramitiformis]
AGADPKRAGCSGTPMLAAVENDDAALVGLLLEHGVRAVGLSTDAAKACPLRFAVVQGAVGALRVLTRTLIRELMLLVALPDAHCTRGPTEGDRWTSLVGALELARVQIITQRLDGGPEDEAAVEASRAPLHAMLEEVAAVTDPMRFFHGRFRFLESVAQCGGLAEAKLLLRDVLKKARESDEDRDWLRERFDCGDGEAGGLRWCTALVYAAARGDCDMTSLFLSAGASAAQEMDLPDPECEPGRTLMALHVACVEGHVDVVRLLLQHMEGSAVDRPGWVLVQKGLSMCDLLSGIQREKGERWHVHAPPLHLAVMGGHIDVAHLLLDAGARTLGIPGPAGITGYLAATMHPRCPATIARTVRVNTLEEAAWRREPELLERLLGLQDDVLGSEEMLRAAAGPPLAEPHDCSGLAVSESERRLRMACETRDVDTILALLIEFRAEPIVMEDSEPSLLGAHKWSLDLMDREMSDEVRFATLREQGRSVKRQRKATRRARGAMDAARQETRCALIARAEGIVNGEEIRQMVRILKQRALLLAIEGCCGDDAKAVRCIHILLRAGASTTLAVRGAEGDEPCLLRVLCPFAWRLAPMEIAAECGSRASLEALLSVGMPTDMHNELLLNGDKCGPQRPALMAALWCDHEEDSLPYTLLKYGARADVRDTHTGLSALHLAAMTGRTTLTMELLKRGAMTNGADVIGWSALHYAAAGLWERKAVAMSDLDAFLSSRWYSTMQLVGYKDAGRSSIAVAGELLAGGANVNAETLSSLTPLVLAIAACRSDFVAMLLKHGARVNGVVYGCMALDLVQIAENMATSGKTSISIYELWISERKSVGMGAPPVLRQAESLGPNPGMLSRLLVKSQGARILNLLRAAQTGH